MNALRALVMLVAAAAGCGGTDVNSSPDLSFGQCSPFVRQQLNPCSSQHGPVGQLCFNNAGIVCGHCVTGPDCLGQVTDPDGGVATVYCTEDCVACHATVNGHDDVCF